MSDLPETSDYSRLSIAVNAVVAVAVTVVVLWLASGFAVNFEALFRVSPTVEGGGIGANWETGNEIGWLVAAIKIVHLADVVMGAFILLMVFIHWGAFRRLASQMQPPGGARTARDGAVTDGGRVDGDEARSATSSDDSGASGGDR
ncbi:hypothetical protein SAMN04487948_104139 [Halogranum amylolyticum]|uniref:Uncharacterized protein n=1 Tax=Halogranum amylolyticum TaxID=660520 RepID=A0A1H8RPR4_9EURY|nr:hypothetical protein [Halogranum amylolyticum]SEO67943.1 hypothetical protein SAMN04487948_104139 [Halogranum amylolyticum]